MHSSAIVALALLAATAPVLSAPSSFHARQYPNTARRSQNNVLADYESGAFRLPAGAGSNLLTIFASAADAVSNLLPKRELEILLARSQESDLESGAFLGAAANIGTLVSSGVSLFQNLFGGNKREAREYFELVARSLDDEEESGAFLGAAANIGTLVSSGVSLFQNLFGGNKREAREFIELMTRADFSNGQMKRGVYPGRIWPGRPYPQPKFGGFPHATAAPHAARSINDLD